MKRMLITFILTLFSTAMLHAQSELVPSSLPLARSQPQPLQHERNRVLPDAPIPVLPNIQDGPLPCPAGIARPCALLGGRVYFRDPSHMTEHDATLGKAMRNPMMVVGGLLSLAATIADIEGTNACIQAHTCREGTPLYGAYPSRAKAYGIGIPVTLVIYTMSSWLKKRGDGNFAFGLLWGGTIGHIYQAAHGFAISRKGSPAKPNSSAAKSSEIGIKS
jgi:hypothetical protein